VEVLRIGEEEGFSKNFPAHRRKLLGKWFAACGKRDRPVGRDLDQEVLWALEESMSEVGEGF
jgi:uncharacterized protein YfeS